MIADPFPHLVIDDYWSADALRAVVAALPPPASRVWGHYQRQKRACRRIDRLPSVVREFFDAFTSPHAVAEVRELSGLPTLIPDTSYAGAGVHVVSRGGSLGVHVDFNELKKMPGEDGGPWYRRLNTFLYLNEAWDEAWGGGLSLHGPPVNGRPGPRLKTIAPHFNRFVVFEASENSWHGHPEPLRCPADRERLSLAVYWYTREPPPWEREYHSTIYVK